MRIGKILRFALGALVALAALAYCGDYLYARFAIPDAQRYQDIRVDQLYTDVNKYGETEWSRGDPVMERCVNSLFPHFGARPCWYVKGHTMHTNKLN